MGSFPHFGYDSHGLKKQRGLLPAKAAALARDRQVLARAAKGDDVYRFDLTAVDSVDITQMPHTRQASGAHSDWKRLNLRRPDGLYTSLHASQRKAPYAIEERTQGQGFAHLLFAPVFLPAPGVL